MVGLGDMGSWSGGILHDSERVLGSCLVNLNLIK